jgi:hypothetical protein
LVIITLYIIHQSCLLAINIRTNWERYTRAIHIGLNKRDMVKTLIHNIEYSYIKCTKSIKAYHRTIVSNVHVNSPPAVWLGNYEYWYCRGLFILNGWKFVNNICIRKSSKMWIPSKRNTNVGIKTIHTLIL